MKHFTFETAFFSLRDGLAAFLRRGKIRFEISGAFGNYHFSILCSSSDAEKINGWLDANTITAA